MYNIFECRDLITVCFIFNEWALCMFDLYCSESLPGRWGHNGICLYVHIVLMLHYICFTGIIALARP